MKLPSLTLLLAALLSCGASSIARSAEIQLLPESHPRGDVVLLGDVARVFGQQAESLAQAELFPAPPLGTKRYVRVREIQDLLLLRGINLVEHSFSGSNQVTVSVEAESRPATAQLRAVSIVDKQKALRAVQEALMKHLRQQASATEPWSVEFDLDDEQVRRINTAPATLAIRGGVAPWTGPQQFVVCWDAAPGPAELPLSATVTLPPAVVVAVRALPRGATIQPGDVQLVRADVPAGKRDGIGTLEAVVGQETTQAIVAGRQVDRGAIRAPIVVKQGEVVTVYARSSGVTVRTTGRARDTGSVGDLITVESLLDRKAYFARVSGIQEVEVYARAVTAAANEPAATQGIGGTNR